MKGGESISSVYLRKPDPDFFRLCRVEQHKLRKRIDLSGKELFSAWRLARRSDRENLPFLTGWMLLHEAEPEMRKMFRKISAKGSRGITTNAKRSQYYLFRLVKKLHTPDRKEVGERTDEQKTKSAKRRSKADKRKGSIVMSILKEVAGPFKRLWGYDKEPPARDYYPLSTSELQELEVSSDARVFMMSQLTSDRIDNKRYQLIQQEVRRMTNITKMVAEPQSMEGAAMSSSAILINSDGQGITLCAPYNMNIDIPFAPLAAMVERMFTPSMATVVIQEHASGGNKQPPKRQILGQINPFYSMVTIYQGYAGQYLTAEKAPEVIQHFYVDRGDLMHFYITAKLHLQAVRRREDMESYILGWKGFDIPYAIDVQQNELLKSRLETDFSAVNSGLNRTTPNCNWL